jgi:hypothetical protein
MTDMTNRERFRAAMAFEPVDRPCHVEWGFWEETHTRWKGEGLPADITFPAFSGLSSGIDLFEHFGVTRFGYLLPGQYFLPAFQPAVLSEDEDFLVERTERGVVQKVNKRNRTIPMFLEYPVKDRADYERLKERLQPQVAKRYPANWDLAAAELRAQDHTVTCTHMDGFFGYPRELMGLEGYLFQLNDDPQFVRNLIEDRVAFYELVYERALRDARPDFAFIWEDMCYRNGPLISPEMFREFLLPAYQRLTAFIRDMGVSTIIVDSDGDINKLIPLWLEGGVTGLLPFEVRAGMDVTRIGEEFPRLQILGGIDKNEIAKGHEAIDKELGRVLPAMLRRGGYAVALDHWVPPAISLDDYRYFVRRVKDSPLR